MSEATIAEPGGPVALLTFALAVGGFGIGGLAIAAHRGYASTGWVGAALAVDLGVVAVAPDRCAA